MVREFSDRFKCLICWSVPRTFLHLREEEQPQYQAKDLPEPPDGFVANYCKAKY